MYLYSISKILSSEDEVYLLKRSIDGAVSVIIILSGVLQITFDPSRRFANFFTNTSSFSESVLTPDSRSSLIRFCEGLFVDGVELRRFVISFRLSSMVAVVILRFLSPRGESLGSSKHRVKCVRLETSNLGLDARLLLVCLSILVPLVTLKEEVDAALRSRQSFLRKKSKNPSLFSLSDWESDVE